MCVKTLLEEPSVPHKCQTFVLVTRTNLEMLPVIEALTSTITVLKLKHVLFIFEVKSLSFLFSFSITTPLGCICRRMVYYKRLYIQKKINIYIHIKGGALILQPIELEHLSVDYNKALAAIY